MMDVSVFETSITSLFNQLCIQQLRNSGDRKKTLVINRSYNEPHLSLLKKRLYRKLFVTLRSPIILPKWRELKASDEDDDAFKHNRVYNNIAENVFHLKLDGFEEDAERLSDLCRDLESLKSTSTDSALACLHLLSNCSAKVKKSSRLKYRKEGPYSNNVFQFDERAFHIDDSGIDLFGSIYDIDDAKFHIQSNHRNVFTLPPKDHFQGNSLMKPAKESKHGTITRMSLFGGLTNSFTTSMDVTLNLPALPTDSYDQDITLPQDTQQLYQLESIDEGFDELSSQLSDGSFSHRGEGLDIFDEAALIEPKKVFSWEKDQSYDPRLNHGYLTECGDKAFDCMYKVRICEVERITGKYLPDRTVSQEQVFRDSLNVLLGVQSSTYSFHPSTFSMQPATNLRYSGISAESLRGLMNKFASTGTHYRQLRKFCSHHSDRPIGGYGGGTLLKAFIDALNAILQSYWYALFTAADVKNLSLMELWHLIERFSRQLKLLADICLCSEAFKRPPKSAKPKFPVGPGLLSYLYSLSVKNVSTKHYPLLLYLFKSASLPYIKFISNWLFNGACNDPFGEFFVFLDDHYLTYRDKFFWSQGFQMKQSRNAIPLFLDDMARDIFACGKSINLLKLTNIQHYLFDKSIITPGLDITFSSERLDEVERRTNKYLQQVQNRQLSEMKRREKEKLEKEEIWKEKIASEKAATEDALSKMKDIESKIYEAIREKKGQELQRLKEQFEAAVQDRQSQREMKLQEDQKFLDEFKQLEEAQDKIKERARDELISFYQALSDRADARERRARWTIDRYELSNKRVEFLSRDKATIEEDMRLALERERGNVRSAEVGRDYPADGLDEVDVASKEADGIPSDENVHQNKISTTGEDVENEPTYFRSTESPDADIPKSDQNIPDVDLILHQTTESNGISPDKLQDGLSEATATLNRSDQSLSEAKTILYPPTTFASETNVTAMSTNISHAKDILYPTTFEADQLMESSYQHQFEHEAGTTVESRREPLGSSALEGSTTRDLIYPSSVPEDLISEVSTPIHSIEGSLTKDLLYPGDIIASFTANHESVQRHMEDGAETKDLLYPSTGESTDGAHVVEGKYSKEGDQTNSILYNTDDGTQEPHVEFYSRGNMKVDSGKQTKDLLYPTCDEPEDNKPYQGHHSGMYTEGKETKNLLYPEVQTNQQIDDEPRDLLPPHANDSSGEAIQNVISEESNAKTLLYPGEPTAHVASGQMRQFEKASTMQHLLYPDTFDYDNDDDDVMEKAQRGFEPPTTIKNMMYPLQPADEEKSTAHVPVPLRPEDVWMDLVVEPYEDDFSVIDKGPHPYKAFETSKLYSHLYIQSEHDESADIIKKLPLETIIKRSLTTPIQAQIRLVNKAVIQYFIEDLRIRDHFDAFRKFLLLEDGEFGHSLCSQLFEKISSGMKPQDFCNTIRLNNIIIEALRLSLYASRIEYSTQLTFSLKSVPDVFQPSDVAALDFLELRYQVPWPCNIIVTENSITKYNKVFSFLIRLKRANWSLQEVWLNMKKAGHNRKSAGSPQLRQLQLFRHEMQHFINNLERYTVNQILHVSWEEFQQDLEKNVNSLDDLHRCHTSYQKKIIFRSLLSKNAAPVYKIINDIFSMISKFERRLNTSSWTNDEVSGHVTHPMFDKLQQLHDAFKQTIEFLFSVISKLVRRGYQDHLSDLLLQVNFNSHYSTAVVS